jgi:hypothetical protein
MSKRVFVAKSTDELEHCYIVIQELRPHLSKKDFFVIYNEAHNKDGYEIVAIEENNIVVAVMGYRILADDTFMWTTWSRAKPLGRAA